MQKSLTYDLPDDSASTVDEFPSDGAVYALRHLGGSGEQMGDSFLLEGTPQAFRALARLFAQLADRGEDSDHHIHIGASTSEAPQGPGWRIAVSALPEGRDEDCHPATPLGRDTLGPEARRATTLLRNKVVAKVWRPREKTVAVLFRDGARLYVDHQEDALELSVESGV